LSREAALHAAGCGWLFFGRSRRASADAALVALRSSFDDIWWIPVLTSWFSHLLAAGRGSVCGDLLPLFLFTEGGRHVCACRDRRFLALARRQYFLPALMIVPFASSRAASATVAAPGCRRLASDHLAGTRRNRRVLHNCHTSSGMRRVAIVSSRACRSWRYAGCLAQVRSRLGTVRRGGLPNTSPESRFLVLTGDAELFCDPVQEWFPALTSRVSATTLQGHEWIGDGRFAETMAGLQRMQLCMHTADPSACIVEEAQASALQYDYVYVARIGSRTRGCREQAAQRNGDALLLQWHEGGAYTTVYQTILVGSAFQALRGPLQGIRSGLELRCRHSRESGRAPRTRAPS
jgi:hypothetical protein